MGLEGSPQLTLVWDWGQPVTEPSSGTGSPCRGRFSHCSQFVAGRGAAVGSVLVAPELWRSWISSLSCPAQRGAVLEEREITAPPGTLPALERLQRLWDVPRAHGMKTNRARGSRAGSEIQGIVGGKDPTLSPGCR